MTLPDLLKKSRIRETPNLFTDVDRSTDIKRNRFLWICFGSGGPYRFKYPSMDGCMDVRTDIRMDERTDGRGGGPQVPCQHITCHMLVQCNAVEPSSIVQFSPAVGWLTSKKTKKLKGKKHKKNHQNRKQ